jgi:hypothetical protein
MGIDQAGEVAPAYQPVDKVVFTSLDLALNFGHRP